MAEKITPPTRKIDRADGVKMPSANTVLTTPNPTFGRYFGSGDSGAEAKGKGTIFGGKK